VIEHLFNLTRAERNLIKLAYAYEQATHHRRPPASTSGLGSLEFYQALNDSATEADAAKNRRAAIIVGLEAI
jgi:hypothetical protein